MAEQRIALVTGANKGIGLAVARGLLALGLVVYLGCRDPENGRRAAASLEDLAPGARSVRLDVTEAASITAAFDRLDREEGVLDILVNNAGIVGPLDPPSASSMQGLRETYETNVFGVVAVTNAMLPLLRRSPAGRIVNLTSDLGSLTLASADPSFPQLLAYNSSKTALNAITVTYANELRSDGILVNAVSPGSVATDQNGHRGELTPDQGARLPIRFATLPQHGPTGTAVTAGSDLEERPLPW
ncbi:SDR family oxidoreductase [Microlunatus speluncae]|uniref:SDR family oxidoreductase n=1 Tax=Microlunatus speluncae TaxID=2594267 RepID=UPI00126669EC|nr:SDR family oxidoreductase [Microlunatus speluncae]